MAKLAKFLQGVAGAAGGAGLDITEVFSTYLYEGNGTTSRVITNGIDLSNEGGLVWTKTRSNSLQHTLYDTERGAAEYLGSNETHYSLPQSNSLTSFNSDGFTVGNWLGVNLSGRTYASWTFRKAPKFFDVVTYTGTGSAQNISHDLGSVPGMIIVKQTDVTNNWMVQHRAFGGSHRLQLNSTDAAGTTSSVWNNTDPTSTVFTVGAHTSTNASGGTYVAYLFAHNDGDGEFGPDGDQDIIKCGAATNVNGSGDVFYDLGWEPQWLLWKQVNSTRDWYIFDNMRGVATGGADAELRPSKDDSESAGLDQIDFNATGFTVRPDMTGLAANGSSDFIYMAIRRGSLNVPESATEVFDIDASPNSSFPVYESGFPVDLGIRRYDYPSSGNSYFVGDRLRGANRLITNLTNAEASTTDVAFDSQDGWWTQPENSTSISWMWKRAPGYFDVVAYTGTGSSSARAVSHNLGVDPEMMWVKRRDADIGTGWAVYHKGLDASAPQDYYLTINNAIDRTNSFYRWGDTAPTATDFYIVEDMDASGGTFIAYLFASLDGISKVGSYTGNGTSQTIDCGFTSGARFVLIKCTTVAYDWQVFDTERGIVAGNDSKLALNTTQAEQTNVDFIDPSSSGFAVTSSSSMNANGETFIFYAIA